MRLASRLQGLSDANRFSDLTRIGGRARSNAGRLVILETDVHFVRKSTAIRRQKRVRERVELKEKEKRAKVAMKAHIRRVKSDTAAGLWCTANCKYGRQDEQVGIMTMCDGCQLWVHNDCDGIGDVGKEEYKCHACSGM
jgi:hypothetical protein